MTSFKQIWSTFTVTERRNISIYILGIMMYKFGLEAFNGSIIAMATDRFTAQNTFTKLGLLQALNQAFQCVGAILIAPLVKMYPIRSVLTVAIFVFGILSALVMIIDGATGGQIRAPGQGPTFGSWTPDVLFPIYCAAGIVYGNVELIRRILPKDIVGGDIEKLRRMDAMVHVFYEVAGTAGAFASAALQLRLGNNFAPIVTPIFFALAAMCWMFISSLGHQRSKSNGGYFIQMANGFKYFFLSIWKGASLVLLHRSRLWMLMAYSLALYGHRYLENGLLPIFAKRVMGNSAYAQIMVGGSNLGELLGAAGVFVLGNSIPTPLPFLRMDALMLPILWYLAFYYVPKNDISYAWRIAATLVPVSSMWAAGDVSLSAYIQASVTDGDESSGISPLGCVMAFLYSSYIIMYAILNPLLGSYVDTSTNANGGDVHPALINIGGLQFTVLAVVIFVSTFIPRGAFSLIPKLITPTTRPVDAESGIDSTEKGHKISKSLEEVKAKDEAFVINEFNEVIAHPTAPFPGSNM